MWVHTYIYIYWLRLFSTLAIHSTGPTHHHTLFSSLVTVSRRGQCLQKGFLCTPLSPPEENRNGPSGCRRQEGAGRQPTASFPLISTPGSHPYRWFRLTRTTTDVHTVMVCTVVATPKAYTPYWKCFNIIQQFLTVFQVKNFPLYNSVQIFIIVSQIVFNKFY